MTLTVILTFLAIAFSHLVSGSNGTSSTRQISVAVQLTLTDNSDQDVIPAQNISALNGTTAFQFLNLAAQQNPCYNFHYETFRSFGRYITSICCVAENKTTNFYWFVYINNKLSLLGIDFLKPNDGDTLKFRYQFINSTDGNHTGIANNTQIGGQDPAEKISVSVELTFTHYPNPNVVLPQQVIAPNGTAALEILQLAGHVNPCYMFQYKTFSFGPYITTICCVVENSTNNFYWFVYINGKPSTVGIDLLIPEDGDTLKFEYQMWNSEVSNHTAPPSVSTTTSNTGKAHQMSAQNLNVYIWLAIGILTWKLYEII